jgi:hypothetical protein
MANELQAIHATGEGTLEAAYLAAAHHNLLFDSQAIGDIPYATSTTTISRLAIGSNDQIMTVSTGVPKWASTITATALTDSGLTSGRIPIVSTGGLLTDISSLAFTASTGALSVTSITTPTGRASAYVIAANNATATEKAQADVVCDGTADDVEINAAIVASPAHGRNIRLSTGDFYLAAPISMGVEGVSLTGDCMKGTNLHAADTLSQMIVCPSGQNNFYQNISDMSLWGIGQTVTWAIEAYNVDDLRCERLLIYDVNNGIYLHRAEATFYSWLNVITDCMILVDPTANGIGIKIDCSDTWVTNCEVSVAGGTSTSYGVYNHYNGNVFQGVHSDHFGKNFYSDVASVGTFIGCVAENGGYGFEVTAGGVAARTTLSSCQAYLNSASDYYFNNTTYATISNCSAESTGVATSILSDTGSDYITVIGNTLVGTISLTGTHNVVVAATTSLPAITTPSLTDSGLTAGRVTFASTGGLLKDDAALTFTSSTGTLAATIFSGSGSGLTDINKEYCKAAIGTAQVLYTDVSERLEVDTVVTDTESNFVNTDWYGSTGAYLQAASTGCSAITIKRKTGTTEYPVYICSTGSVEPQVLWASDAAGVTNVGLGYITARGDVDTLTIAKKSGADFANNYYYWIKKHHYLVPATGTYFVSLSGRITATEDQKRYGMYLYSLNTTATLTSLIVMSIGGSGTTTLILSGAQLTALTANDMVMPCFKGYSLSASGEVAAGGQTFFNIMRVA